jgi:ankyrin repeat protein
MGNTITTCSKSMQASKELFCDIKENNLDNLENLMESGANLNKRHEIKTEKGSLFLSPLELAIMKNNGDAIRKLARLGAKATSRIFEIAIQSNSLDALDKVIKRYPEKINERFITENHMEMLASVCSYSTPLSFAIKKNNLLAVKMLLDGGADIYKSYINQVYMMEAQTITTNTNGLKELKKHGSKDLQEYVSKYFSEKETVIIKNPKKDRDVSREL